MLSSFSKKAISSHILILGIISLMVSSFFILTLNQIYGSDNKLCQSIDFDVKNLCIKNNNVNFQLINNYNSSVEFKINEKRDLTKYYLKSNEKKEIQFLFINEKSLEIVPIINKNNEVFVCNGVKKSYQTNIIRKC